MEVCNDYFGYCKRTLYKKLKRNTLAYAELSTIADALGVNFELAFTLPDGEKNHSR
jgi:hypothetical protein